MTAHAAEKSSALLVTAGARICAIPVHHVVETMRPLPIESVAGTPEFLLGISIIRGVPTPVVALEALLERGERSKVYRRFVTLKVGERRVALAVSDVVGLRGLALAEVDGLLRYADTSLIETIGTSDAQLLVVLRAARIVPEEVWATLATRAEAR